MSKVKKSKPTIGNKKPTEVKEKKKRVAKAITPPPAPIPFIDGILNPLFEGKRNKRAFTVALANLIDDDEVLCEAVREAGIVYKSGLGAGLHDTKLLENEWSGRGYALRTGRAYQKDYTNDHKEQVEACYPYCKALIKAMNAGKVEEIRTAGLKEYDKKKGEVIAAATERKKAKKKVKAEGTAKAKKPEKPGKGGKNKKPKKPAPAPAEDAAPAGDAAPEEKAAE